MGGHHVIRPKVSIYMAPAVLPTLLAACLCGVVVGISHEAEGSGIGPLYPEGWRMIDRYAGIRYECKRKGKGYIFFGIYHLWFVFGWAQHVGGTAGGSNAWEQQPRSACADALRAFPTDFLRANSYILECFRARGCLASLTKHVSHSLRWKW